MRKNTICECAAIDVGLLERIAMSLKHSLLQANRVNPLYLYNLEQDPDGRSIRPRVILL